MRLKRVFIPLSFALVLAFLPAAPAAGQKAFDKAVKKVEASFSPAEAKPGQTVTFSVTIELNDGYHTYPTVQTDKMAASMVNEIKFPDPGANGGNHVSAVVYGHPQFRGARGEGALQDGDLRWDFLA